MKERYFGSIYLDLIEHHGYLPVIDENGDVPHIKGNKLLQKYIFGRYTIIELIDADLLSVEDIENRLLKNADLLKSIVDIASYFYFCVFVFNKKPEAAKIQAINDGQYGKRIKRRYQTCFSVNLNDKKILRHFVIPITNSGLEKYLIKSMNFDYSSFDMAKYHSLDELVRKKEEEYTVKFTTDKYFGTFGIIALNILIWTGTIIYYAFAEYDFTQIRDSLGVKNNLKILDGEYWRFITPIFLHLAPKHILFNTFSLYSVGKTTEKIYGLKKFLLIYLMAGIFGNITSFCFSPKIQVGASGGIFGLLGALLYYGLENPAVFSRYFGLEVVASIFVNIYFGMMNENVDNFAHIGGLIGGFLIAGVVKVHGINIKYLKRPVFMVASIIIMISMLLFGFIYNKENSLVKNRNITNIGYVQGEKRS